MPPVFAFAGRKQAGKGACANIIKKYFPDVVPFSFAGRLKEGLRHHFDFSDAQLYGELKEVPDPRYQNRTPRSILQEVGTDYYRKNWPGIWISHFRRLRDSLQQQPILIDDLRFADETAAILEQPEEAFVVVVINPDEEQKEPEHSSEDVQQVIDAAGKHAIFLVNDKKQGLEGLEKQLVALLKSKKLLE